MVKNKPIFWAKRIKPNDFMGSHLSPTSYPQSYPQISWKTINHLLRHALKEKMKKLLALEVTA